MSDSPYVQTIFEDHRGTLWIGTTSGLARLDRGTLFHVPRHGGFGVSRRSMKMQRVCCQSGLYDTGLARLDHERLTRYTEKDRLFNNGVFQILEDDQGFLWLSCHLGIYRIKKQDLNDFSAWPHFAHHVLAFWESRRPAERRVQQSGPAHRFQGTAMAIFGCPPPQGLALWSIGKPFDSICSRPRSRLKNSPWTGMRSILTLG